MPLTLTGTITGIALSGLTTPTYTTSADTGPNAKSRQSAVTTLGGTQTGVTTTSVSDPFTFTYLPPNAFKALGPVNPLTGALRSVPFNTHRLFVRKGVTVLSGQPKVPALLELRANVPANAETLDKVELSAQASLLAGWLSVPANLQAFVDAVCTGVY